MPDEQDKPNGAVEAKSARSAGETENERPTVTPPFDPAAFAREKAKPSGAPTPVPSGDPVTSPPGGTPSNSPPHIPLLSNVPRSGDTPLPAEPVDREWAVLEIASRPPPDGMLGDDPLRDFVIAPGRAPRLDLDDIDLGQAIAEAIEAPAPQEAAKPPRSREMKDRVSLGDYSGALEIAEKILAETPSDAEALACAENCRTVLRQMYMTRIGPIDKVPIVAVPRDQLRWLSIDHKAGFVLSLIDGVSNLEMIIDVSGMPELDTLRILSDLVQQRVISLR